ncbi:efflux RND transporter permease subunit [Pedomonas mirosovicensis]|uniref:efflux RND transporter permease subunit n=1 Tax=Pedomonas mirosovicensis TaxID=2908641 RepID=UPI002167B845|nr:efflux RND transporter permease subunit [Pedomonas mirosovicensis]MCH8685814.1 efflux RND transporter permease subunit [Pedomonas mirosovicensis]
MRNMSSWAIRNPIPPIVLFAVLTVMGFIAFMRMPINNMPDVSFPVVQVTISQPGAAPTEMEMQITQIVEGAVASVGNVRNITSRTIEGTAFVIVEFQVGTPVDRAVNDVRDAVTRVRSELPEGILEPNIQRIDTEGGAMSYMVVSTTDLTPEQLSWFVDNSITKRLLTLGGIAQVQRIGGVSREIRIDLDPSRLQAMGLSAADVNQQLRMLNLDAPGGRADVGGSEQAVRVLGGAKTAQQLADTRIIAPGGRVVRLSDIAQVRDGVDEQRSLTRQNGRLVTAFSVTRAKGSSEVSVYEAMHKELDKIRKENPKVQIEEFFTTVGYTKSNYNSALWALIEGSILAVVVVFLFLRDWRATLISALAIPLSAIPTFLIMDAMGFTLNMLSLLALSLVAGILVDDAIVEIENIVRHMRMGKSPFRAAMDAADEIGLAVVATTMSIVAVFLPVGLMGGISGQYFKEFGLTVAVAVFMSLLVARLITPLIAAYFLKPEDPNGKSHHGHADGWAMKKYMGALRWSLRHRWITLFGGVVFFLFSIFIATQISVSFMPPIDDKVSVVNIELPPGSRLDDSARVSAEATKVLKQHPQVVSVLELVGENVGDLRKALLLVNLTDPSERKATQKEIEQELAPKLAAIPDARINFQSNSGGFGRDISVVIGGDDPVLLEQTANKIVDEMRKLPTLHDPRINGDLQRPEIVIKPRFDLAAEMGVSVSALSQTVRIATMGDVSQNLAKFSLSDRQVPIRVSLAEGAREDLSTLENLPVPTSGGNWVPLKSVADITFGQGPTSIRRYNQSRRIVVEADVQGVKQGVALAQVEDLPTLKNLPQGVRRIYAGNAEFQQEMMTNFMIALLTGVMLVFAVIVLLYKRAFQPIVNMGSLLLAPGGAFLALLICGFEITLPVFIGILMLFGIVAKNSILLVDFAIEEIRLGKDRETALIEAGHKRAQPIIMTTIAMIAGMLPVAIGLGADTSFRAPMALSVIGGLITSTVLTLVIVPAGFTVVDDIEKWLGRKLGRLITTQPGDENEAKGEAIKPHPVATAAE